jgi:hypothetical protein
MFLGARKVKPRTLNQKARAFKHWRKAAGGLMVKDPGTVTKARVGHAKKAASKKAPAKKAAAKKASAKKTPKKSS